MASGATNHWSAEGGTPIVVAQGETAGVIANRYGVPTDALLKANGLQNAKQVQPGARIVIPVYRSAAAPAEKQAAPAPRPVAAARPQEHEAPAVKTVAKAESKAESKPETKAETKSAPVKTAKVETAKQKAAAAKSEAEKAKTAKVEPKPAKAEAKVAKAEPKPEPKAAKVAKTEARLAKSETKPAKPERLARAAVERPEEAAPAPVERRATKAVGGRESTKVAVAERPAEPAPAAPRGVDKSTPTASIAPPQPAREEKVAVAAETDPSNGKFRWPARGRIIQGFNGGNDGINIAVPAGTQVKAAEEGVVAYAGNELKGYGNLVLIRHQNGFVSAYAHNGEIEVKRGDKVSRGQTIAKSGQSGDVGSPQLHFELRKDSRPVDPTTYLAGI